MRGIARSVEGVLDALGYDRVDVVGVSLGGVVAQQLARQAPQRVRRLVLAATGPGLGGVPGSPRVLALMATPRRYRDPDYFQRVAGRLYGGAARHSPKAVLPSSSARFLRPPHLAAYLGQIYAITGWTSVPWLRRLPQPTLVLAGDDDPIVPAINARIVAHLIPDATAGDPPRRRPPLPPRRPRGHRRPHRRVPLRDDRAVTLREGRLG